MPGGSRKVSIDWELNTAGAEANLKRLKLDFVDVKNEIKEQAKELKKAGQVQAVEARKASGWTKKLAEQKKQLYDRAERGAKKYAQAIERAQREQKEFGVVTDDTRKSAERLKKEWQKFAKEVQGTGRDMDKFAARMARVERSIKGISTALKTMSRLTLGNTLKVGGAAAVGGAAIGVGGAIASNRIEQKYMGMMAQWGDFEWARKNHERMLKHYGYDVSSAKAGINDLLANSPMDRTDLMMYDVRAAAHMGGNTQMLNEFRQMWADIASGMFGQGADAQDIGDELLAGYANLGIGEQLGERYGAKLEDVQWIKSYEEKLAALPSIKERLAELNKQMATSRVTREMREEEMQLMEEMKKAEWVQAHKAEIMHEFLRRLAEPHKGAALQATSVRPVQWLQSESGELVTRMSKGIFEWAGSYYEEIAGYLHNMNAAMDNIDSVLGMFESGKALFRAGAFDSQIKALTDMAGGIWNNIRSTLEALVMTIKYLVLDGAKILGLYVEDAIIKALRAILPGTGGVKSSLEEYASGDKEMKLARERAFSLAKTAGTREEREKHWKNWEDMAGLTEGLTPAGAKSIMSQYIAPGEMQQNPLGLSNDTKYWMSKVGEHAVNTAQGFDSGYLDLFRHGSAMGVQSAQLQQGVETLGGGMRALTLGAFGDKSDEALRAILIRLGQMTSIIDTGTHAPVPGTN